ncbi:hypothetical protein [Nostoc linckia]|jgi:hypothetical protein|nr:hypothetical protein [Nostoc linckia]
MRELIIFILTIAALLIGIIALCKQQANGTFYLKIEVQYGK